MGIVLLTSIICTTIVYSAFNTELQINGEAVLRSNGDLRITELDIVEKMNGAYETYSNKHSKDITSMYVTLPSNSSITYQVTITNKLNIDYDVSMIKELVNNNSNVIVDIKLNTGDLITKNSSKKFTITISNKTNSEQVCNFSYQYSFIEHINSFKVGDYDIPQSYEITIPYTGEYKIELWGASGGDYEGTLGGRGAYVRGNVVLKKGTKIYVFVGENPTYGTGSCYPTNPNNSFNGSINGGCVGGGGATDVRLLKTTNWYDEDSLRSRIMVSAGGGGSWYKNGNGGYGGELIGGDATGEASNGSGTGGMGATQSVYLFGYSDFNTTVGGGGYYGGQQGRAKNAGGGSSYISGYKGCIAVTSATNTTPKCSGSTSNDINCSYHYSGYKFTNMLMIGGNKEMTSPSGDTEIGHTGDGYARITFIKRVFD